MRKLFLILITLLLYINIFPQSYSITGQVEDQSGQKKLGNANVTLSYQPSSVEFGMAADNNGRFTFNYLSSGKYIVTVSYIGYKAFKKTIEIRNTSVDLKTIYLTPENIKLKTVNVTAEPTPLTVKNDTTEYNAGAFKTNKDADAEDLLTKMPGVTIQNGTVQAQGENVDKILVDGKPYFGSDPNAVLKNLPAGVVEKVQVFDQASDQAQFTGFDDGNTSKTINIVTKLRNKQGSFGKFTGGYGDDQRYAAGGTLNLFNGDQRITVLAQINNVNQQNFSIEDLLGVMSGGGRMVRMIGGAFNGRGNGGGAFIGGRGPGGGFGGNSISNFLVNQSAGLVTTKAFGMNYSDKWGQNVDLTGSYFFNYSNNVAASATNRNYFLTSPQEQVYNETNSTNSQNVNHRFNLRLNYQIDDQNSILFTPSLTAQINNGLSNVLGGTTSGGSVLNSTSSMFNSQLTALNSVNDLLLRHKFAKQGRTLSIDFNASVNNNSGNNNLLANDIYYGSTTTADTLNQNSDLSTKGFSGSSNIVYTEPLGDYSLLQLNTKFYYSQDNSDQKTFSLLNNSSLMDSSLSNVYRKIYRTQTFGGGYRYRKGALIMSFNLNYNLAELIDNQTFPQAGDMERTFHSVLPSMILHYRFSGNNNIRFFYTTTNEDPSITQLQNVLNNSNPTQLSIGNPNLSQDYKHNLILRFMHIDFNHMNSLFGMLGATVTQNYIGNNTILAQSDTVVDNVSLNRGTKLVIPENLNGYVNLRSFIAYGLPVSFIKSNINLHLSVNYTHTPGIINGVSNYANSATYGIGFVVGSNISEQVDFTLSSFSSINNVSNDLQSGNTNYFTQTTDLKFYWDIWKGFVFQNEFNDQYNKGLPSSYKPNILLWNLSLGKKIFKDESGEIMFSVNDLLNQNTDIQHNVSDSYVEDVRTNVLGRYYLLSFIYSIRNF